MCNVCLFKNNHCGTVVQRAFGGYSFDILLKEKSDLGQTTKTWVNIVH